MYTYDNQKLDITSVNNIRQLGGYEMPNGKNDLGLTDEDLKILQDTYLK